MIKSNMKKIIYFIYLLSVGVVALCLEYFTSNTGPLLDTVEEAPQLSYAFGMACVFSTMLSSFFAIRMKGWSAIVRMSLVIASANLIVFDYYFFYDTNMIFCLPLLGVVYLFLWPSTEN